MIKTITFSNFKVLRDVTLDLGPFTLLIGPNGSGKSTVLQALLWMADRAGNPTPTVGVAPEGKAHIKVVVEWDEPNRVSCERGVRNNSRYWKVLPGPGITPETLDSLVKDLRRTRGYAFQGQKIAAQVQLQQNMEMGADGFGLACVLDRLRDQHPERFEALNAELARWVPEFDRVLFDTPGAGQRSVMLRRRGGGKIPAADLSQGTLFALAVLTLAHLPEPPPLVCLEEPDHGMHPRLLRDVRDAIYRLAYPQDFGEKRQPVQVVATTHSPYMLDLFRDHPEEIVIAQKTEDNVVFERLSDRADLDRILRDTHLGDAWYSGILGGVPAER